MPLEQMNENIKTALVESARLEALAAENTEKNRAGSAALSYTKYAQMLQLISKYPEAEPYYRKALALQVENLGEEHPRTSTTLLGMHYSFRD